MFVVIPVGPAGAGALGATNGGALGIPRIDGLEPKVPAEEDESAGAGSEIRGLTPALPISTDPNGMPVRDAPPGDVGTDAVGDAEPAAAAAQGAASPANVVPVPVAPPTASPPPS
jgi:hypothetical protein